MDWFLGWLIGWLIDWLTDGLTGSLMDLVCYFFPFFLFFAEVFNGGWVQLPDCCSLNGTDRVVAMAANIESQFLHVSCSSSFWDSLYRFCWDSWPDAPRSRHRLPFSGTCRDFLLGPGPSSAKDSDATKDSCQRFDAIDWYSPPGSIRNLLQGGNWVCVCVCGGFAAILLWDSAGLTGIDSDDGSKFFFQGSADGILVGIFRDSLRFSGIPEHSSRSSCQNPLGSLPKFPILLIFSLRFLKDSFGFLKMILCVTFHLLLLWRILVWMDPPCPWHYLRLIRIHVGFSQGSRRRR